MRRPLTIGVGGAHSGVGKTVVAEALLRHFTNRCNAAKGGLFSALHRWGALKYTKTAILTSIVDDRDSLSIEGKDTWRLLKAGAEQVVWLQSPPEDLPESIPLAFGRLGQMDGVIIEGNSAIEFTKPDVILFIDSGEPYRIKPSGSLIKAKADIVVVDDKEGPPAIETWDLPGRNRVFRLSAVSTGGSSGEADQVDRMVRTMDDVVRNKIIESLLAERSQEGRISCTEARRIAEETGVGYGEVGKTANRLRIKIRNCELGCF